MTVLRADGIAFDAAVPVVVVGGGACGMVAALAAHEAGADVVVIERDSVPRGSTALSSGLIPACGTRFQRENGIDDSVELMAADIQRKAHGRNDAAMVETICRESGPTIDWLADDHGVAFRLVDAFLYPGHSTYRMHGPPDRTGSQLIDALAAAVSRVGIDVITDARVVSLYAEPDGRVAGIAYQRPDGTGDRIGCDALVLACSGFGGNPDLVRKHIPEMAAARYFGHVGNQGDAVLWGEALGAGIRHMGAYQGHGSVAVPQEALLTWAVMMEGGFQVNAEGRRFSNEHGGYSEQAVHVLNQPGGVAWNVFDQRLCDLGMGFEDFRLAMDAGAAKRATTIEALAAIAGLPPDALAGTLREVSALVAGGRPDRFGRDFTAKPALVAPYYIAKVTGALFHTQGGLAVDTAARVCRPDGSHLPNLLAGGGAACGISGTDVSGYLSGNGLLAATVLGRLAGSAAARTAAEGG